MTKTLRLILGDQLSHSISALNDMDAKTDIILLAEVMEEASYVHHHKKKIVYLFSAMRAFAKELRAKGLKVDYICLDDAENGGSFSAEVERAILRHNPQRLVMTEPGEYRVMEMMRGWKKDFSIPVEIRSDDRFIATRAEFARWAEGRKNLRMEFFYREMRRKTGILMNGDEPEGGQWNYDHDNRKAIPDNVKVPDRPSFPPSDETKKVIALVKERFSHHFGDIEPFDAPVTRNDALKIMAHFIAECLPRFGDYQDAMKQGEPFLFHSLLSAAINCGLLLPLEVVKAAEAAYRKGDAPLNAVEGFIRQIIGWREYVRGIYWLKMPHYKALNHLGAKRKLPDFYYTGETKLNCLRQAIMETKVNAYAHHIQRLMVTGNFALIAGLDPDAVNRWYLEVYWDAYEWVELPNTHGMVLFADGGYLASKPYAASGNYINKMSDYCKGCSYDVAKKNGPKACPLNYLYWNFMEENRDKLKGNPRLSRVYSTYDRMSNDKKDAIKDDAARFLKSLK